MTNFNLQIKTERVKGPFDFEAAILFALAEGKRKIYCCDRTPPPFQKKLLTFLENQGENYELGDYLSFTASTPETIKGVLTLVNWVDSVIFILDRKGLAELGTPVLHRNWLGVPKPFEWFYKHAAEWEMFALVGVYPCRGVDIVSEKNGFNHLFTLVFPVIQKTNFEIKKADFCLT